MKKLILSGLIALFLIFNIRANADNSIIPISTTNTNTQVLSSNSSSMNLQFHFGDINYFNVKTNEGIFTQLQMAGAYSTNRIGEPVLPAQKKLIAIPFGAEVSVSVNSYSTLTINLDDIGIKNKLMPLQYDIPKNIDPSSVPFQYKKEAYNTKGFNQNEIAKVEVLGVMRGVRIARITVEPARYNPSANQLQVINDVDITLSYSNANADLTNSTFRSSYSPLFDVVYQKLLNVNNVYEDHPDLLTFPVNMLIVADPMFADALQPFIDWKTLMGYYVTVGYTDVIGSSSTEIADWVHNQYNTGLANGNAPVFVVFVGDVQQVVASGTGSASGKKTDLYYASVDGDMFPEMYYGRLSAQTVPQLEAELNKIIYYEKYQFEDPTYLDDVTLIAGADASGNPYYGQPTINYGTQNYFNADHGYNNLNVYLDSYSGCYDNQRIGVSFVNYTAHGSQTSWADPSLNISDVNSFSNNNSYPIVIGNCCLAADFGYNECFGEAWLRADNKGAAGYIGSSPSSYWKSDMYWSVGAYSMTTNNGNGYVPTFEETTKGAYDGAWGNSYYCLDALVFVGDLSVTEVNAQGWLNDAASLYYWEAYNTLGDPSMMPYNTQGSENAVTHMDILPIGITEYEVSAEPGSYVAISKNGIIHGTALVDSTGVATVQLDPVLESGDVNIVVTKSQFIPYITTVPAAALSGPYLTLSDFVFDNGTTNVDYATSDNMSISISNLGTDPSDSITVTISFTDDYCTLISPITISVGSIAANETTTISDAYSFNISDDAPDMHKVNIGVQIEGTSKEIWQSSMDFDIHAPIPTFGTYTINDASGNNNGRIDPGETVDITVQTLNNGNACTLAGFMTIGTTSPYITVNTPNINVDTISAAGMREVTMNISADAATPVGALADFNLSYTAGNYSASHVILETIGLIVEDFETGDFTEYNWQFNEFPWVIVDSTQAYEGGYAAKSDEITDSQSSIMEMNYPTISDGEISFFYKVSSENTYDFLIFYINGEEKGRWSGEVGWTEAVFSVVAGDNTFKWEYSKDYSVSSGDDCAWVDYILLPPMLVTSVYAGPNADICEGNIAQCTGSATNYDTIFWHTSGTGSFNNINSLTPVYTPSTLDVIAGNVSLSLNIIDAEGFPAGDTMELSITHIPAMATTVTGPTEINLHDTTQCTYSTDTIQYADVYVWSLSPTEAGEVFGNETTCVVSWNNDFIGNAYVKVKGQNVCGVGISSDSLLIDVKNIDDVSKPEANITATIIPNPTNGLFTVTVSKINEISAKITITNQYGAPVYSKNIISNNGNNKFSVDLSNQASGSYFLTIKTKSSIGVSKIILVK